MDQQQQQQTPQWSPPPQQPAGWGGGGMAPASRPLGVTLSAIWFYFIGIIGVLAGAAAIAVTSMFDSIFNAGGGTGGFFAGLGIFAAVVVWIFAALLLLTGYGLWKGRGWGRIGAIVWGVIGILLGLAQLSGQNGLVGGIISIAIWAGVIYAVWMAKSWFAQRA